MSYFTLLDVYKKIGKSKTNNENGEINTNKTEEEILTEEKIGNKIIAKEFNRCKENLKLFSEQIKNDINLPTVDYTSYIFFDHTVTGTELNRLTAKLQEHLIGFNNINGKIIKEFEAIYNTFNALDNEYIKEIMQSIEKSNEAINKANQGLTEAEKRIEDIKETNEKIQVAQNNIKIIQDKLKNAQQNIDRNIEFQKKIVEGLSKFKNKIDSYEHLKDIDSIWNDLEKVKNSLYILEEKQEKIENLEMSLQDTQNENISFSKKLNISYFLGGGALILTLFNTFYLFLRG